MTMKRPNRRTLIFASVTLLVLTVMIICFREPPTSVDSAPVSRGSFLIPAEENTLQVPASALFRDEGIWMVYVIEDGEALRRPVIPGRRSGLFAEIQAGLEPGERVILHPGESIAAGVRVRAR